jgi:uncharacterized protein (TIGR03435 family)
MSSRYCQAQGPVAGIAKATPLKMEFDVASVKQNKSGPPSSGGDPMRTNVTTGPGDTFVPTGGIYSGTNVPLIVYIYFAYQMNVSQNHALELSLPAWAKEDRFDIQAKTDKRDATKNDFRLMMRSLLEQRFGLAIHEETREGPVYALVLEKPGKLGPRLRTHPANDTTCTNELLSAPPTPGSARRMPMVDTGGYPVTCGGIVSVESPTVPGKLIGGARNITMEAIANSFAGPGHLENPVIDQTGLTGTFDFTLDFAPELPPGAAPSSDAEDPRPTFRDALAQQLGLKLVSGKGSFDIWVVDHIDHPTPN